MDVAKKLTIVKEGETVQWGVDGAENFFMDQALILSNGGHLFNADYTKSTMNTPEVAEVLQAVVDLRKVEGVSPESNKKEFFGTSTDMLQTGKIAMLIDGSWSLQLLSTMHFPVGVGVLPKFKEAVSHGQGFNYCLWNKTPHPSEAWTLAKFLSSEEYQIDLIRSGLWMPNRSSLYTAEGIAKWYNPDVHPKGFKEMAIYFRDAPVKPLALNSHRKAYDIFYEEADSFFHGNEPIGVVLARLDQRVNEELAK